MKANRVTRASDQLRNSGALFVGLVVIADVLLEESTSSTGQSGFWVDPETGGLFVDPETGGLFVIP